MHEAIMEVIGHPTYVKPELPDLSSIPHVLEHIKHLNGRTDGEAESNGPRGDAAFSMKNKEWRDRKWKDARGE